MSTCKFRVLAIVDDAHPPFTAFPADHGSLKRLNRQDCRLLPGQSRINREMFGPFSAVRLHRSEQGSGALNCQGRLVSRPQSIEIVSRTIRSDSARRLEPINSGPVGKRSREAILLAINKLGQIPPDPS